VRGDDRGERIRTLRLSRGFSWLTYPRAARYKGSLVILNDILGSERRLRAHSHGDEAMTAIRRLLGAGGDGEKGRLLMLRGSFLMVVLLAASMGLSRGVASGEDPTARFFLAPDQICLPSSTLSEPDSFEIGVTCSEQLMGVRGKLLYDSDRIRVTRLSTGDFLGRNGGHVADLSSYSNESGEIQVEQVALGGDPPGVSGSGSIMKVFLSPAGGDPTSDIRVESVAFRDTSNANIPVSWPIDPLEVLRGDEPRSVSLTPRARRYGLYSLPLSLPRDSKLSDALRGMGAAGSRSWLGYALIDGRLKEDPVVTPARGYWLATASAAMPVVVSGAAWCDTVEINLSEGFSSVGVPSLDVPFLWSEVDVRTEAATVDFGGPLASQYVAPTVWWYVDETGDLVNNGDYEYGGPETESLANRDGGYLLYARQPCRLVFPNLAASPAGFVARPAPPVLKFESPFSRSRREPAWTIRIAVQAGGVRGNHVEVGVMRERAIEVDSWDVMKPPFPHDGIAVAIIQEDRAWTEFMRAYDSPEEASHEWAIRVSGKQEVASLEWDGLAGLPPELHPYLVDPVTGRGVEMRAEGGFDFVLLGGSRSFTVLVSDRPFAGELLGASRTAILEVTPNPAKGPVRIVYGVGRAGPVALLVCDISGRQVAALKEGIEDRGQYDLSWQPDASRLGSGVYFLHLRCGREVDSRRFLWIR